MKKIKNEKTRVMIPKSDLFPYYSDQDDLFIDSTDVLTVVDPSAKVAKQYLVMLESKEKKTDKNE